MSNRSGNLAARRLDFDALESRDLLSAGSVPGSPPAYPSGAAADVSTLNPSQPNALHGAPGSTPGWTASEFAGNLGAIPPAAGNQAGP